MAMTLVDGSQRRRWQIWQVFTKMDRDAGHTVNDISRATGIGTRELIAKVKAGELEARRTERGGYLIPWPEIATLAIEKWGLQTIFAALGPNGMRSIPPLVRPRELVMTLPAYQYVMLERLAAREGISAETYLSKHLLDLAGSIAEEMEQELPGFIEAMWWPDDPHA